MNLGDPASSALAALQQVVHIGPIGRHETVGLNKAIQDAQRLRGRSIASSHKVVDAKWHDVVVERDEHIRVIREPV